MLSVLASVLPVASRRRFGRACWGIFIAMTVTNLASRRIRHEIRSAAPSADEQLRLFDRPRRLADGVIALRRFDGLWCDLSGLDEPLLALLDSEMLAFDELGLSADRRSQWRRLLTGLQQAGLAYADPPSPPAAGPTEVLGEGALAGLLKTKLSSHQLDLRVLCSSTIEPDRGCLRELDAAGLPYLVIRADGNWATIGPLVSRRDGGLCCLDQRAIDDDPSSWQLLLRLSQTRAKPEPWVCDWIVGQVLAQLRLIAAGRSSLVRSTLTLTAAGDQRWHSWSKHAQCCGASQLAAVESVGSAALAQRLAVRELTAPFPMAA